MLHILAKKVFIESIRDRIKIIETCWGRGYRLHETVYEQVYLDADELKYGNE